MEITAIQFLSSSDVDDNLSRMEALLAKSLRRSCDLVVFPEAAMVGFGSNGEAMVPQSQSLEGPFVSRLVALAESFDTRISAGMFETNGSDRPFNTTVVVSANGIEARYRKIHLYDAFGFNESSNIAPGDSGDLADAVLRIGGYTIGLMTCFDLRFPEVARTLALAGVDTIALGAAWVQGPRKIDQWLTLLQARAIENGCYLVAAGQPSPRYCGHSSIIDPMGRIIVGADAQGESSVATSLDTKLIAETRAAMPLLDLRRITR